MFKKIKEYFKLRKEMKMEFEKYKKDRFIQASEKPHFTMESKDLKENGIQLEMDWNNSFIKELRKFGYEGITDEQVIEGYLHKIFEKAYMKTLFDPTAKDEE